MYQIGDWVQFEYNEEYIHGVIVPYTRQDNYDHSDCSYLIKLAGFVDPTRDLEGLRYHGWLSTVGGEAALYLWIGRTDPTLAYYRKPLPPRPVSPVFYMVKEAT